MFFDFRPVAGTLKARAKQLGLLKRDAGAIKPAHEFRSRASLACARASFGEKDTVSADAGIDAIMCHVKLVQNFPEGIAQSDTLLDAERSDCVQHVIDRIVLRKALLTLGGDAEHHRSLVFVRRSPDQEGNQGMVGPLGL